MQIRGQQLFQLLPELRHTLAQHGRVERHIDTGDQNEGPLTAEFGTAAVDFGLQRFQTLDRARDRVLRTAQVQVDDLEEFPDARTDTRDEVDDLIIWHPDLRWPDGGHPIIAAALRVPRHQLVHGRAALEDDLQQCLQRQHTGDRRERVVFADRMSGQHGALDVRAGLAQFGDLGHTEHRHGDLGELGQVQHTVRVPVFDTARLEVGRIVPDHGQDRKAQCRTSVLVGALPDLLGGLGAGAGVQAHALALNALAREGVDGLRGGGATRRGHDQIAVGAAGDLDDLAARVDCDPLDAHVDLRTRADHTEETGGPGGQSPCRNGAFGIHGGHRVLRGGRKPHAVHDRAAESGQLGGRIAGVDGVVVTGDRSEGTHGARCQDGDIAAAPPWGFAGRGGDRTGRARRIGQLARAVAAADGEAFGQRSQRDDIEPLIPHLADGHLHLDDASEVGVDNLTRFGADNENAGVLRQVALECDLVIEVDQIKHALDDTVAVGAARGAEHREDGGPARADEHIGHAAAECAQRGGQARTGDARVIGDQVRAPGDVEVCDGALHLRQRLARGNREQCGHGGVGIAFGDDRRATVVQGGRHGDAQADAHGVTAEQRHRELDIGVIGVRTGGFGDRRTGRRMYRALVVDGPFGDIAETVDRIDRGAAGPFDIRRGQHRVDRSRGDTGAAASVHRDRRHAGADQRIGGVLFEAVEQFADRLVDPGDTGDRDRARNHADLIGRVARIMGLPQRIRTPPAAHIAVHHRHEVHRLPRGLAQADEERHISRVQHGLLGRRVLLLQRAQCFDRLVEGVVGFEQRRDLAAVGRMQPGFGAAHHLREPVTPGDIEPDRTGGIQYGVAEVAAAVEVLAAIQSDGQLDIAFQPLEIGHGGDIAEIRLGRGIQGGDDLVATLGDGVGVTGDLVEQATGPRCRIVDLVDIGAQLATAGGHSAARGARADPVRSAGGVDEQLLDLGGGGGLERRHGGGTDQHAVERHHRITMRHSPFAGQIFGGALRSTDAAADADHHIVAVA